ncbi:LRAT domain [Dillenia turbinata]|uniref:LRAT domain n=1 Tax=Dillenia turbinata TaxID=194707 RepID=A0AAN8ZVA1_9MAGN
MRNIISALKQFGHCGKFNFHNSISCNQRFVIVQEVCRYSLVLRRTTEEVLDACIEAAVPSRAATASYLRHRVMDDLFEGIYMGEKEVKELGSSSSKPYETVIHYTRTEVGGKELSTSSSNSKPCRICNYKSNLQRGVVETCLNCFLLDGQKHIYLYEYGVSWSKELFSRGGTCSRVLSGPPSNVEDLASRLLMTTLFGRYHLLRNNCENFAHFCSTGSSRSLQVESLITSSGIFMEGKRNQALPQFLARYATTEVTFNVGWSSF